MAPQSHLLRRATAAILRQTHVHTPLTGARGRGKGKKTERERASEMRSESITKEGRGEEEETKREDAKQTRVCVCVRVHHSWKNKMTIERTQQAKAHPNVKLRRQTGRDAERGEAGEEKLRVCEPSTPNPPRGSLMK